MLCLRLYFQTCWCVIHNLGSRQDIRFMRSLISQMPLTCSFIISDLSLCGLFKGIDFGVLIFCLFCFVFFYWFNGLLFCSFKLLCFVWWP